MRLFDVFLTFCSLLISAVSELSFLTTQFSSLTNRITLKTNCVNTPMIVTNQGLKSVVDRQPLVTYQGLATMTEEVATYLKEKQQIVLQTDNANLSTNMVESTNVVVRRMINIPVIELLIFDNIINPSNKINHLIKLCILLI